MTAKTGVEKEKKQTEHQQSLKGVLADVLQKSKQETTDKQQPKQHAAAEPPREKKPFEVSEDALRKVLKGDI